MAVAAVYGAYAAVAVGAVVGISLLMRQSMPVQPLGDIAEQTAREGVPRLIVWGIVRPIGGNMITPRKLYRRVRRSNPPVVAGIYAIGVCEGPISRFRRIWRNAKLVYDDTGTEWGARNNGKFLANYRLYNGSWDQMPDTRLQATFGAEDMGAFRGTAYMVAGLKRRGEDLSDTNGAVPTWTFEVERREGDYLTTTVYPIEDFDESISSADLRSSRFDPYFAESTDSGVALISGSMSQQLVTYDDWESEGTDVELLEVEGSMKVNLLTYTDGEPEATDAELDGIISGVLRVSLVEYEDYAPEATDASVALVSGSMT